MKRLTVTGVEADTPTSAHTAAATRPGATDSARPQLGAAPDGFDEAFEAFTAARALAGNAGMVALIKERNLERAQAILERARTPAD